jgi:Zn-dependent protease with chaperone function
MNIFLSLISALFICGCATVPETGRQRLSIVSDQQIISAANVNFQSLYNKFAAENRLVKSTDSAESARTIENIREVTNKVIDASGYRNKAKWEVFVVRSKEANAFVLPNGKIFVFTGILPIAANDAGLAAIIGHEISHVVAGHLSERMGQMMLANVGLRILDKALEKDKNKHAAEVSSVLGIGIQYGILLPFSRSHELEADRIGMLFMAKAGYDPTEAAKVWVRMDQRGGSSPWEFLSTHPSNQTRQAKLREFEPEARQIYLDRSGLVKVDIPSPASSQAASALHPIAFQPKFKNEFWYKTRVRGESTVTTFNVYTSPRCSEGVCTRIEGDNGLMVELDDGLGTSSIKSGKESSIKYRPALRNVQFPLAVGSRWKDDLEIGYSNGRSERSIFEFSVDSYEPITVLGNDFAAFKISVLKDGKNFREGWYAPETGTFVLVNFFTDGKVASTLELVDYKRGFDVSGGLAQGGAD